MAFAGAGGRMISATIRVNVPVIDDCHLNALVTQQKKQPLDPLPLSVQ